MQKTDTHEVFAHHFRFPHSPRGENGAFRVFCIAKCLQTLAAASALMAAQAGGKLKIPAYLVLFIGAGSVLIQDIIFLARGAV